jgi:hypothetical protein
MQNSSAFQYLAIDTIHESTTNPRRTFLECEHTIMPGQDTMERCRIQSPGLPALLYRKLRIGRRDGIRDEESRIGGCPDEIRAMYRSGQTFSKCTPSAWLI